ncbi:MAG: hypothetical protein NC930_04770, partial [Candidatus Omnitrophica bacterium]|nr:hypothetical protein [Candidatus Omnitrophota bacterium]
MWAKELTENRPKQRSAYSRILRGVAVCTVFVFSMTSAVWIPPAFSAPETQGRVSDPANPMITTGMIKIPAEFGAIEEQNKASDQGPLVILIQDAHAIPDAQSNIERLIGYLQKTYGIPLVALEGAESGLDAQIFKSFPDQKKLKAVLQGYYDRGELSGGTGAAILNTSKSVYHGIEDW